MDLAKRDSQSKIIFGPGDKLKFIEQVARDPRANHFDARVAIAISARVDKFSGAARVGREALASATASTVRGVHKSVRRLERLGHLAIEHAARKPGRGHANTYRPAIRVNSRAPFSDGKGEQPCTHSDPKRVNSVTRKGEQRDTKGCTAVHTLPNTYLDSSLPRSAGALEGALSRWQEIKEGLSMKIGRDKTEAWFDSVTVAAETEGELVLLVPQGIRRKHIEGNFMPAIEAVCGKPVRLARNAA
jgi:hypothetical protein